MYAIIVGAGRVGLNLSQYLIREGINVTIIENISFGTIEFKPGIEILSILIPLKITIKAERICPINFTYGGMPFQSSIKQKKARTKIPPKKPLN